MQCGQLLADDQDFRLFFDGVSPVDTRECATDQEGKEAECSAWQDRRSDRGWSRRRSHSWTLPAGAISTAISTSTKHELAVTSVGW